MPKTIQQQVTSPETAAELYRMYLNPERHAAITGAPVKIRAQPGLAWAETRHSTNAACLWRPGGVSGSAGGRGKSALG